MGDKRLRAVSIGIQKAIDELYRTREERKILQMKEEQLSDAIKNHMMQEGLELIETKEHCALLSIRLGGAIDPEAYYEALDEDFDKFLETVSVRKETNKKKGAIGADYYLSKETIESITSPVDISALRITKITEVPEQKPAPKLKAKYA
jgi:hypothetical protein